MLTSTKHIFGFVAGVALLLGAWFLAVQQNQTPMWKQYQQQYFQQTAQSADISVRQIVPQMTGEPELCVSCHIGLQEISLSHPVEVFGCVSCHGGNPLTLEAEQAHIGMRGGKNPSDLTVVAQSCGQGCHGDTTDLSKNHVEGVQRSLQATYAGGIAAVRFAFGAQTDELPQYGVFAVTDNDGIAAAHGLSDLEAFPHASDNPIDLKFAENCLDAGCHLSEPARAEPYFYRATGCAACHVLYENDGLYQGDDPTIPHHEPGHMQSHRLTTAIPYTQCNHCHNRGNYSLRQMDFLLRDDLPPLGAPISAQMPEEGRRLIEYYQPIGKFTLCEWELDCIDCHSAQEAMGDGDIHPNQQEMQYTQCQTCHGTVETLPNFVTVTATDTTVLRQSALNPNYQLQIGDQVVKTSRDELLGNVQLLNGQYVLTGKVSGVQYPFNPVKGSGCQQDGSRQDSAYCHQCHTYQR